jgi:aspartyl-tRNA(Asn)/glutamyl-tRNA(Gln) amidotransferase subunit A
MASLVKTPAALSVNQALGNIARDNSRLNIVMDLADNPQSDGYGPLRGIPVLIKSNIAVKGLPFTAGIGAFRKRIAEHDAYAVEMLRRAGAAVLGTVNMEEAAFGAVTNNPHFGRTENPRSPGYTPGGSSGGSAAAVAASFARVALGTDTMGSCRIPAAYCGVVGFKPSFGRISTKGVEPLSRRLDHVGILAASVADVRPIAEAIFQFDAENPWASSYPAIESRPSMSLRGARFSVLDCATIAQLQPDVGTSYRQALSRLQAKGATLIERAFDQAALSAARRAGLLICEAELAGTLSQEIARNNGGLSAHLCEMIAFGMKKSAPDLAFAHRKLDESVLVERVLLDDVDGILWPTAPQTSFRFDDPIPANQADFTCLANFTGAPAISVPLKADSNSLPVGMQLMTTRGSDAALLDLAMLIEETL